MDQRTHLALAPVGAGDQSPPVASVAGPQDGPATSTPQRAADAATIDPGSSVLEQPPVVLDEHDDEEYQRRLGVRLRAVRRARELRLQDVEERSGGRFKAVVVGSYERGDRAVSAHKLAALAAFYDVPVGELLPDDGWSRLPPIESGCLRLSLAALQERAGDPGVASLLRLVQHIRGLRGDHQGRVVTVRTDDLRTTAITLGVEVDDLPAWLDTNGLLDHR